uniref:Mitochondrial Carrier (MC) Family putative n=1 Tax=Albugo laibachii Nc14 TaxID=890382 RepID=F0W2K7_9STRA|nr:Mitochondrial Carrier (MC) Family putative [Albugo laibachii Nc14]|eukprot:CCA15293.1 Mitochondrial Carrier (MC) Family putative [Albugo laibachii Nc14]
MTVISTTVSALSAPTITTAPTDKYAVEDSTGARSGSTAIALARQRQHFAAGAIGGIFAAVITSPLEVVKTRLQVRSRKSLPNGGSFGNPSTWSAMRSIARNESVFGLWRGITPTLVGVVPARAAYFGFFRTFKYEFEKAGFQGSGYNLLSAAGAGSLAATFTCPIWVLKTRLQLLPTQPQHTIMWQRQGAAALHSVVPSTTKGYHFTSVSKVAVDMYKREGARAFFRGLSASYWGISESAIQFALYEESRHYIDDSNNLKVFLAAGLSKLLASALTYPHEVVRTRMRDQRAPMGSNALKYRSMVQSIKTIFLEEGFAGLYGGLSAHLMRVVPNAAIMFLVVETLTRQSK